LFITATLLGSEFPRWRISYDADNTSAGSSGMRPPELLQAVRGCEVILVCPSSSSVREFLFCWSSWPFQHIMQDGEAGSIRRGASSHGGHQSEEDLLFVVAGI
jgi:hypothetical protein